jgi:hypothetical protein
MSLQSTLDQFNPFKAKPGDSGPSPAEQAAAEEAVLREKRKKARGELTEAFSGYGIDDTDSPYFKKIGRNYRDFAMNAPVTGILDQRKKSMGDLIAQLSRQGLLNSSTAVSREALAKKLFAKGQIDASVAGKAAGERVRGNLRTARGKGIDDINAAIDPASSANLAMGSIDTQTDPGKFDPILDVFYELTRGLQTKEKVERRQEQQGQINQFLAGDSSSLHS